MTQLGFDAGDSNLYRYVNNAPTDHTDPSGFLEVTHITTPQNAVGIIENGFTTGEAGLVWFSGEGAGPGGPSAWVAQRPAQLRVQLNWTPPELPGNLLAAAEQAATQNGLTPKMKGWYPSVWQYVMNNGGEAVRNGFRVRDGNGWHYALTQSGLTEARPRLLGGGASVASALSTAANESQAIETSASSAWKGKAIKGLKIGGKVLLVVAIAADTYSFATATNKAKRPLELLVAGLAQRLVHGREASWVRSWVVLSSGLLAPQS